MVVYNESAHADIENIQVPFLYRNGNGRAHSQSEWAQSVEFLWRIAVICKLSQCESSPKTGEMQFAKEPTIT